MIVSFTGAQSTGKTTLLTAMRSWDSLKNYTFVDEITRNVNKSGMKINEDGDDSTQLAIMNAHIENLSKGKDLILDRCSLDGVVYTQYLYNHGNVTKKTLDKAIEIFISTITLYDKIFYLKPEFDIVKDGVRSTSTSFRDEIVKIFDEYIEKYKLREDNVLVDVTGTVEERLVSIENIMHLN